MNTTAHGWQVFDAETPILTYEYAFGPGTAHSLAVGGNEGLTVISPPFRATEGVFADLSEYGAVRALIASNAFHHLGLPEWKARFPKCEVFAPAQSIARVEKHTQLRGIRPLAEAVSIAGTRVELVDMPYYKTGETLVRIRSGRGLVWYVTDVIMNFAKLPANPVAALVFWLSGSAPGLKYNNIAPVFMMKDKRALRRWLAAEFHKAPPRWLIPAHGDIVDLAANSGAARALFGER